MSQASDASGSEISNSQFSNPFGYTSRRHDKESELLYFRARYYDVTTGEFTSRDPLEYVDGMSRYRGYFTLDAIDPFGFATVGEFLLSVKAHNEGGKAGWGLSTDITWFPPGSVQPDGTFETNLCCNTVGFYQIVRTGLRKNADAFSWLDDWHNDTEALKRLKLLEDWIGPDFDYAAWDRVMVPKNRYRATLHDDPGVDNPMLTNIHLLRQEFESCAVCVDPKSGRYREVFGCAQWGVFSTTTRGFKRMGTEQKYWGILANEGRLGTWIRDDDGVKRSAYVVLRGPGKEPTSTFLAIMNEIYGGVGFNDKLRHAFYW